MNTKPNAHEYRGRATEQAAQSADARQHSLTTRSQDERFAQRRARDEGYWDRLFAGTGVEWTDEPIGDEQ